MAPREVSAACCAAVVTTSNTAPTRLITRIENTPRQALKGLRRHSTHTTRKQGVEFLRPAMKLPAIRTKTAKVQHSTTKTEAKPAKNQPRNAGGRSRPTYHGYRSLSLAALLLVLGIGSPLLGQPVRLPRAQTPVVLFGFEGPEGASGWHGLNCRLTNQPVSEGTQAMSFVIPKYGVGGNRWPATIIDWNGGRGYAVKDWSHYAKLTFDAWIDCDQPSELAIELRDTPGKNGAAAKRMLQPGRKTTIEVLLSDLAGADMSDIQEILLWASQPSHSFGVTVDNFRLVPGEKLPLVGFDLLHPNYRSEERRVGQEC